MSTRYYKAVFFDLYGTLFVPEAARGTHPMDLILRDFFIGRKADAARWESIFESLPDPASWETATLSRFECRLALHCEAAKYIPSEEELHHLADKICGEWQKSFILDPQAFDVLHALKNDGRSIRLITNFDHPPHVRRVLQSSSLAEMFDKILVSGEEGVEKPDPELFFRAFSDIPLAPRDGVYLGDSRVDYEGALNAGMRPILIRRGEQLPDPEIDTLVETGRLTVIEQLTGLLSLLDVPHG